MKDDGRWDSDARKEVPKKSLPRVEAFFDEYEALCRRMGLSLGHEDGHGAFEIGAFSEGDIEWARYAHLVGQPAIAADPTVPGRCATCRWAVEGAEGKGKNRDEFLQCTHAWTHGAIAGMEGGYCDAGHRIEVEPDFGCVQWEAKDDPAPETP